VDSQVKERVVGAAVLVALGVLIIPWVLDGPDRPRTDDGAEAGMNLPAAGEAAPVRTEIIELEPAPSGADPVEAAAVPPAAHRAAEDAARTAPPAASGDAADARASIAAGTAPASTAGVSEPLQAGAAGPAAAAGPVAADAGAWSLQLGAFGNVAGARQLVSRAETVGYAAEVSEIQSGGRTLHRVRVGGFGSRNEAEAAQSSLAAHGLVAQVVPPE